MAAACLGAGALLNVKAGLLGATIAEKDTLSFPRWARIVSPFFPPGLFKEVSSLF